jgi:REP element-mobilizing transposase RayT
MRSINFVTGEYYHIYNRGVDKRNIFLDQEDIMRFFRSMQEFNVEKSIGSIYETVRKRRFRHQVAKYDQELVKFVCYCLNPNHYHFLVEQVVDGGISKFMKKLGGGYSCYFNEKHKRSGTLFQGPFKAIHVSSDEYLLHLSAYINLNNKVHRFSDLVAKLTKSSWEEYINEEKNEIFCNQSIILNYFESIEKYKTFALSSLGDIIKRKDKIREMEFI